MDSHWLQQEYIRQAQEKYAVGDYMLDELDGHGQRITIILTLPRQSNDNPVMFKTGWMVYPNGNIQLTTVFGGW